MYLIKSDYYLKLPNETYIRKNILTQQKIFKRKKGHILLEDTKGEIISWGLVFFLWFFLFVLHFHCQPKLKSWFRSHM